MNNEMVTVKNDVKFDIFGEQFNVNVIKSFYMDNGRVALFGVCDDGEPFGSFTVNVPDVDLADNEVCIKNYSESVGNLDVLVANGVVSKSKRKIRSGFVEIDVCDLLV